ncbi:MAG: hypothetical protein H0U76_29720, partial [Ktedonobacteraceae bacterium]|nr:hypothetical protein [Ktedonobacteraceae bacterium]
SDFYYDGLNRQVARVINGIATYSVWDGAERVAEYDASGNVLNRWIYAGGDLVRSPSPQQIYYYPDGLGSTSRIADANGIVLERYTYDVGGKPSIYAPGGTVPLSGSAYGVDMLFTGQKWYSQLGIYDLRNRAYLTSLGRFLQPDAIGFGGDPSNLYRYCGNNPVNLTDPNGLQAGQVEDPAADPFYDSDPSDGFKTQGQINEETALRAGSNIRVLIVDPIIHFFQDLIKSIPAPHEYPKGQPSDNGLPKPKPSGPPAPLTMGFITLSGAASNVIIFARDTLTGGALWWSAGTGLQPIGNAPADVRWAPNSGTGNYEASQFTLYAQGTWGMWGKNETGTTTDAGHTTNILAHSVNTQPWGQNGLAPYGFPAGTAPNIGNVPLYNAAVLRWEAAHHH